MYLFTFIIYHEGICSIIGREGVIICDWSFTEADV